MENLPLSKSDSCWPQGQAAAVSLTFDDGRPTQLEVAVPLLDERKLRGTFYLNRPVRARDYRSALEPWRPIFKTGHELGNHTFSHPCSRNLSGQSTGGLEGMSLEDIERDILKAEERLREVFPESGPRSFAYPCYLTHVGEGLNRKSYVPVVARHFVAGRAAGEYGFFNHPFGCDLHCLTSFPAEHVKGPELVGLAERAARRGHWLIYDFHTIDDDRLGCSPFFFTELLDHLADNPDRFWVAPVARVALHLEKLRRSPKK